jgi:hypothetical protein
MRRPTRTGSLLPATAVLGLLAAGLHTPAVAATPSAPAAATVATATPLSAPTSAPRGRVDLAPVRGGGLRAADVGLGRGRSALATERFSMVAVTWRGDAPAVDVRVRRESGWSAWRELEPMADGPGAAEATGVSGTDLLWVGDAHDVRTRVRGGGARDLTLVLLDPTSTAAGPATRTSTGTSGSRNGVTVAPALATGEQAATRPATLRTAVPTTDVPAPVLRSRKQWGADESWRNSRPRYIRTIKQVHVHHTVNGNGYRRREVPGMIRGMYRYHTHNLGWSDIGYNFLVDRFGRAWVGRKGGPRRRVRGAHTLGFNHRSTGISVIGNFEDHRPPKRVLRKVARLSAWKLDMDGRNPRGRTWVRSQGSDKYADGRRVRLPVIDGHRDTNDTACPGQELYDRLPGIRRRAARRINRTTAG